MGERPRVGRVLCWAYLALLAVVVAWMAYQFVAHPATSELAWVGVVALALPWSLVLLPLAMMLGGVASLVVMIAGIVGGIVLKCVAVVSGWPASVQHLVSFPARTRQRLNSDYMTPARSPTHANWWHSATSAQPLSERLPVLSCNISDRPKC